MKKTTRYSALAIALLLLMASMCGCQSGIGKELATSWRMMTGGEQEDPAHELFEEMKEEAEAKKEEIEPAEQLDLLVGQEPGCPDCRDRKTMIEPFKYSFFMGNDDATMKKMYREYRKNYLTTLPLNISEVNNYRYALLLEEEDFSHYDPVRNAGDLEIPYNIGESLNADGQNGFVTPKEFQEMPNGPEDKKKIIDLVTEFMELEYSDSYDFDADYYHEAYSRVVVPENVKYYADMREGPEDRKLARYCLVFADDDCVYITSSDHIGVRIEMCTKAIKATPSAKEYYTIKDEELGVWYYGYFDVICDIDLDTWKIQNIRTYPVTDSCADLSERNAEYYNNILIEEGRNYE